MPGERLHSDRLPPKPDDALPDTTEPHGPCPRCGRMSNFTLQGASPLTFDDSSYALDADGARQRTYFERLSVLQCQGCTQNIVVVEEQYTGGARRVDEARRSGVVEWRGIHWWPAPGMRPGDPAVPVGVAEAVSEGVRCLAVRAPRAAAVMFRAALGQIVADRGSVAAKKQRTLFQQLKQMADEGTLVRDLSEWADHIRTLGNAGAHPNELDAVSMEEAEELSRLIVALIEYLYVMPARVVAARRRRS